MKDTVDLRDYREEVTEDQIEQFNERHVSQAGQLRRQTCRSIEDRQLAKELGISLEELE